VAKNRIPISHKIEDEILFRNRMKCCVCHKHGVNIHHLDENPANNNLDNLIVLCQIHHDEVHKKGGLTKNWPSGVLKKFKYEWEKINEEKSKIRTDNSENTFSFEIKKTIYEIIALDDSDIDTIQYKIDYIDTIRILENKTNDILTILKNAYAMIAFSSNKSVILFDSLYNYFGYLFDPKEIGLTDMAKEDIYLCIDIIESICSLSGKDKKYQRTLEAMAYSYFFLYNRAILYKNEEIKNHIIESAKKIKKDCLFDFKNKNNKYVEDLFNFFFEKIKTFKGSI
jgi:hypothetical protein